MKTKTIREQITPGGNQSQHYTKIFSAGQHTYRIEIHNDHYNKQSYGKGFVLHNENWDQLVYIPGELLKIQGGGYGRNGNYIPYYEDKDIIAKELYILTKEV